MKNDNKKVKFYYKNLILQFNNLEEALDYVREWGNKFFDENQYFPIDSNATSWGEGDYYLEYDN